MANQNYSNPGVTNYVSSTARIGKNVKIWHFAYVGNETEIGDNVMVGSLTIIGKNVFIGPGAAFTNDPYPMSPKMAGVIVEDGAIIGGRAVIKPGIRIGRSSVVAMAAVVTRDVPPDVVVMGHPAKIKYSRAEYNSKQAAWNAF